MQAAPRAILVVGVWEKTSKKIRAYRGPFRHSSPRFSRFQQNTFQMGRQICRWIFRTCKTSIPGSNPDVRREQPTGPERLDSR